VRLILFEDGHAADLAPLTDLLPVHALAFGDSCLGSRWLRAVPEVALDRLEARPRALAAGGDAPRATRRPSSSDEPALAINVAALPGPWLASALAGGRALWTAGERVVGASAGASELERGRGPAFADFLRDLGLPATEVDARVIRWPWELVEWSPDVLTEDLESARPESAGDVDRLAALYDEKRISIGAGARVDAYAVLDARSGPIRLAPRAVVRSHTLLTGPCIVGEGTELLGGVIGRSTIGPECRIAGEADSSVWQGFANKRHHGFVGHSAIGEWVNLGALTTTSDLKNTYGEVRVWAAGREVATGCHKIGSFVGAHVKTGIGTLLPTGASIGTASNLFGGGRFAPKRVPAFSWWDGERSVEHRLERFLETASLAMSRRGRVLDAATRAALEEIFASARVEREGRRVTV
jgi:UDP-N-acetylglucosamine diphosphorylase/glucosamine-1-phosphate N-acetyltransferase